LCLFGGPDGGDGGKGGDVIIEADTAVMNLWGFKKKHFTREIMAVPALRRRSTAETATR